jgi:Protein of unknown function (DUF721).
MNTAGNILSALFDEQFMKKAKTYSKFFDSWKDITEKNGIAAAADHSQIKDLDRGILLIEIDHPGWKQILQTKQTKLLNDFRIRFPELGISGISLMLGSGKPQNTTQETETAQESAAPAAVVAEAEAETEVSAKGYDAIKDEEFRETLKKLGQSIAVGEKSRI